MALDAVAVAFGIPLPARLCRCAACRVSRHRALLAGASGPPRDGGHVAFSHKNGKPKRLCCAALHAETSPPELVGAGPTCLPDGGAGWVWTALISLNHAEHNGSL